MTPARKRLIGFLLGGLLVSFLLAGVVSNFASISPDGLDSATLEGCTTNVEGEITGGTCAAQEAGDHELKDSPLADYAVKGIDNEFVATGLSGVIGVAGRVRDRRRPVLAGPAPGRGSSSRRPTRPPGKTKLTWEPATPIRSTSTAIPRCTGCRPR